MEKIFNKKNFNNFVWSPLGSRGNIYINFCLQVHFQVSAAWYCSHYLPPVSLIPVPICHRRCWHQQQMCRRPVSLTPVANLPPVLTTQGELVAKFATGVNNTRGTGGKICHRCRWYQGHICRRCGWYRRQFATGVIDTGGKFATGVDDTDGAPWLANISANFRKNLKWS